MAAAGGFQAHAGFTALQPHETIETFFTLGQQLGQPGQYGRAVVARSKDGRGGDLAMKIISKARFIANQSLMDQLMLSFRSEIEVMRTLKHPNIIEFVGAYEDRHNFYIAMELCTGGELFDRITASGHFSEREAAAVLRQILEGLKAMHAAKIAHLDLKPDNFLFKGPAADSPLKIIDFGMSRAVRTREYLKKFCGTPYYVAPEVIEQKYDEACDMWSVGVVLFVMLHGYPPFYADPKVYKEGADARVLHLIKGGFDPRVKPGYGAWFPEKIPVSDGARDLISRLLVRDTRKRLTATEALEHPWTRGETASASPLSTSVLMALKTFQGNYKLKAAVVGMMAAELPADVVQQLKVAFRDMDKNGDGEVTLPELTEAMGRVGVSPAVAEQILRAADTNRDGKLSYEEVTAAFVQRQLHQREERLWDAFCRLDKNGDGRLNADELRSVLASESPDRVREIIAEVDTNGDGSIDYGEFLQLWMSSSAE